MHPTSTTVAKLCDSIHSGETVIPDFQRDFVWKPDDIHDLLVSVLGDFYIGTMLTMNTMYSESPFALRLIEGVSANTRPQSLVKIILDGQQRSSSLYYALYAPDAPLPGRKTAFRFYLNVEKADGADWDSAVEYHPVTRKLADLEAQRTNLVPFTWFPDVAKVLRELQTRGYNNQVGSVINAINRFQTFSIQIAELSRETPLDRVVETFERINRTGLPLRTFDLLVAKLYIFNIKLRELLDTAEQRYLFLRDNDDFDRELILRLMCVLRGMDIRKNAILDLDPTNFITDWWRACDALEQAYKRITDRQHYAALDYQKRAPFTTMIVPLAAMLSYLETYKITSPANSSKIDQWYWSSVFDNRYNEAVNTKSSSDYNRMLSWFTDDKKIPDFIRYVDVDRIDFRVKAKSSSIYRGVLCLVIKAGARDFKSGKYPFEAQSKLEDDHIFPKSFGGPDFVVNRTLISSNQSKSDKTPSVYFSGVEALNDPETFAAIMTSHLIDANGSQALKENNIDAFTEARIGVIRSCIRRLLPLAEGRPY